MKIALLIIASEVLDGKTKDINTTSFALFLRSLGYEIHQNLTIRDSFSEIQEALQQLFTAHDLVVTSGGLGPTQDDLTKQNVALFFKKNLVFSDEAYLCAQENYARLNQVFSGKNHGYSFLPENFVALSNINGFAPGLSYFDEESHKGILCAPGVPWEFISMIEHHFQKKLLDPFLSKKSQEFLPSQVGHFVARTKNIPEEKIFSEKDPDLWAKLSRFGELSSLPHTMGVDIGIKYTFRDSPQEKVIRSTLKNIFLESPIKEDIWHFGSESLEHLIVQKAREKNITFGFAESATGGLCSDRITNISGSSSCFVGSVICYHEKIKEDFLGVKKNDLNTFTAVSSQVAEQMALGLQNKFNLDCAVSITGYAEGAPNSDLSGTVFIGVADRSGSASINHFKLTGDRERLKRKFSQQALYLLLEKIITL